MKNKDAATLKEVREMCVETKYVVKRRYGKMGTFEDLLIRVAKVKLAEQNGLSDDINNDIINHATHPIITPTSETEAK